MDTTDRKESFPIRRFHVGHLIYSRCCTAKMCCQCIFKIGIKIRIIRTRYIRHQRRHIRIRNHAMFCLDKGRFLQQSIYATLHILARCTNRNARKEEIRPTSSTKWYDRGNRQIQGLIIQISFHFLHQCLMSFGNKTQNQIQMTFHRSRIRLHLILPKIHNIRRGRITRPIIHQSIGRISNINLTFWGIARIGDQGTNLPDNFCLLQRI